MYDLILTLPEVKNYLRVDDDFNEDDAAISRMVAAALDYISKQTNHVFKPQERTYHKDYAGNIDIYDYPARFTDEQTPLFYSGFVRLKGPDSATVEIGYQTRDEIPPALIEAALQMVKCFYFEAEKQVNTTLLPESVKEIINSYRRAIAF